VPKEIIDEMNLAAMDGVETEEEIGFAISLEIMKSIYAKHPKIHLMTHNRFALCAKMIDELQ